MDKRVGWELYEDGTVFIIEGERRLRPFNEWIGECIKSGKVVPTTVPVDDVCKVKETEK
jgi:hypothetical protein